MLGLNLKSKERDDRKVEESSQSDLTRDSSMKVEHNVQEVDFLVKSTMILNRNYP